MRKFNFSIIFTFSALLLLFTIFYSCIKEETFFKATIETSPITSITEATAICGGFISTNGGSNITACGVCYDTTPNPTLENDTTVDAVGTGHFCSLLKGLLPNTTYYVRAYAVNKIGISYGLQMTFTTRSCSLEIRTSSVTATSAISYVSILTDGDFSPLTLKARGLCWSTSPSPTINDTKITIRFSVQYYDCSIDSLIPSTTYYVRAFATNDNGTIYSNEVSFTTLSGLIGLTTNAVTSVNAYTATSGGTILSDGGATIFESGVCWSVSENPTTSDNKTTNGSISGSYTSLINGLTANTTYFIRAWATNSVGTAYGNQISFTTLTGSGTVTDIDGNIYTTVKIGTQVWMVENLKTTKYNDGTSIPLVDGTGWYNPSTPRYCWYNNDAANKNIYGALYNWYTVNTNKLAPTGWHVPTDAEWTTLENYLIANGYNYDGKTTGNNIAKSLADATGWYSSSDTGAIGNDLTKNNSSGFAGLPGGYRNWDGSFGWLHIYGGWWCSSSAGLFSARVRSLYNGGSWVTRGIGDMQYGFSVRCVRDF